MLEYYDKDGIPISHEEWVARFEDFAYKRVARSKVFSPSDPSRVYDVSTVWLGLDHGFLPGAPPIIFETMVFADGSSQDLDMRRYATLEQAKAGHVEQVTVIAATLIDPVVMDTDGEDAKRDTSGNLPGFPTEPSSTDRPVGQDG